MLKWLQDNIHAVGSCIHFCDVEDTTIHDFEFKTHIVLQHLTLHMTLNLAYPLIWRSKILETNRADRPTTTLCSFFLSYACALWYMLLEKSKITRTDGNSDQHTTYRKKTNTRIFVCIHFFDFGSCCTCVAHIGRV